VTGIKWDKKPAKLYHVAREYDFKDLPEQFALDLPENILNQANKKQNSFNDVIETFVYNFLTHKFNHEVNCCSIWLPLEDKDEG